MGQDDKSKSGQTLDLWGEPVISQPADSSSSWDALLLAPSTEDGDDHPFEHPDDTRYERRGLLGRGGMGRVLAVLDQRLRREVALKEVNHRSGGSREANARLAREAWITAQLEHPGIVPVYDAGLSEQGRLFYTMRLIRGRSLEEMLSETDSLDTRMRQLRAVLDACHAVAYAHSIGIVHRDIKPANIMIGEFGETQVVDWGLARPSASLQGKRWQAQVLPEADLTHSIHGVVAGTPAYMSPEQASGEPADERSDVWGLGAVLYEVLTGRPPFTGADSREVLKKLRTRPPDSIASLVPDAPPELIAIAERALRRDPDERYSDARTLAADVVRYVDGRHVRAYAYTPIDYLRRFLAAWWVPVTVTVIAAVAIGMVGLTGAMQTAVERDRAQVAEQDVRAALQQADDNLALALVQQARTAAVLFARPEAEILAAHALALAESPEARGVLAAFDIPRPRLLHSSPIPDCVRYILSASTRRLLCTRNDSISLWDLESGVEVWSKPLSARGIYFNEATDEVVLSKESRGKLVTLSAVDGGLVRERKAVSPRNLLFSRDGSEMFSLVRRVHFRADGSDQHSPLCPGDAPPNTGAALSDGQYALLCVGNALEIGSAAGMTRRTQLDLPPLFADTASTAVISEDERWMAMGTLKGMVALIDLHDGSVVRIAQTGLGLIQTLAISLDGRILAIAGERGGVRLWHQETGAWLGRLPSERVHQIQFVNNDELFVLGESTQRWHLPSTLQPLRFPADGGVVSVTFSPDSALLASAEVGLTRVWSVAAEHREVTRLLMKDQPGVTKDCAFATDGAHLISGGMNTSGVRVFQTDDWSDLGALIPGEWSRGFPYMRRVGALQNGLVFGLSYLTSGPEVWRIGEPDTLDHLRVPERTFWEGETNHSGTAAVLLDDEDRIYRLTHEPSLDVIAISKGISAADISSDGSRIALARPGSWSVISAETGEELLHVDDGGRDILDVAFSADDRYLAAGQVGGVARIWSAQTGVLLAVLRGHHERVPTVEFSPDGRWLATGSWDSTVRLWGLSTLHTPAKQLVEEIEAAWQLTLSEALTAEIR